MVLPYFKTWSKTACYTAMMLVATTATNMVYSIQKASAAQIYSYIFENFDTSASVYRDPSLASEENKCLNGLLNRLPQTGDKETTEACLNTFGYNPERRIKSPVMIVLEIGKNSQEVSTTLIYQSKNGQTHQEHFQAVGARYQEWNAPSGIYTLDYLKPDSSRYFEPAYGNFYSPKGEKDKNGHPVNIGFHGREGNLMAGNGSNGCYRHRVADMKRILAVVKNVGQDAGLPSNWYENTLPIAVISPQYPKN